MRAFGPLPAFLFSWTGILASRPGSIAIISSICSEYAVRLIFGHDVSSVILKKLFAILIVLILTAVNIRSTKFSTKLQTATTAIKLISVGGISLMGFIYYSNGGVGALDKSFFDNSSVKPGNYALALFSALWAYDGYLINNIVGII
jgi:amino acid transporter